MIITDGFEYIKQIKHFDMLESEIYMSYVKRRKVHPLTGEILPKFFRTYHKDVARKVDSYFEWLERCYYLYLREIKFDDDWDKRCERLDAFKAEAARIKNSEYTAKITNGTPA